MSLVCTIPVASADVDETLRFEVYTNRKISADEMRAIGSALIQASEQIKQDVLGRTQ